LGPPVRFLICCHGRTSQGRGYCTSSSLTPSASTHVPPNPQRSSRVALGLDPVVSVLPLKAHTFPSSLLCSWRIVVPQPLVDFGEQVIQVFSLFFSCHLDLFGSIYSLVLRRFFLFPFHRADVNLLASPTLPLPSLLKERFFAFSASHPLAGCASFSQYFP